MQNVNPSTAPACKISGLKEAWMGLQTVYIFSGPIATIFNDLHFDENHFTCYFEKENKKGFKGFKFCTFMG